MGKEELQRVVLRVLHGTEHTGADIHRKLTTSGMNVWSNHLYALLKQLEEEEGLLESRWENGGDGAAGRRRLYRLSEAGEAVHREMLREAVGLLANAFAVESDRDLPSHVRGLQSFLEYAGVEIPTGKRTNVVLAIPRFDPLTCFPVEFRVYAEAYPKSQVHVVKPPGTDFGSPHPRVTFLDGFRHDMPLKDHFADHLWLEGFPATVSTEKVLRECLRVVKPGGHLAVQVSEVQQTGRAVRAESLAEYAAALFYEFYGEDGAADLDVVRKTFHSELRHVQELRGRGNVLFMGRVPAVGEKDRGDPVEKRVAQGA